MFRGANERRISCIRRTLTNPEYILILAIVVLGVLGSNISPSSSLVLDQHSRIEGFIANNRSTKRIHRRPRGYCFSIPLSTRLASSSSVFISSMSYSYNDDQSNRSNDYGKSHSGKRQEQGKRKDPQRREANANAAPLYITIGKISCPFCFVYLNFCVCGDRRSSRMIEFPYCTRNSLTLPLYYYRATMLWKIIVPSKLQEWHDQGYITGRSTGCVCSNPDRDLSTSVWR